LEDGSKLVQEMTETRWSELMPRLYVSSMEYQAGLIPVTATDAATNTAIDKHLANSLALHPDLTAAWIGWTNGDVSGMRRECWYSTCTTIDYDLLTQFTRSEASTSSELVRYSTSTVAGVTTRTPSSVGNKGRYSVEKNECYILAMAAGRETGMYGTSVLSRITFSENENMLITFCQAFYNSAGTALGVIAIDTEVSFLSYQLAGLAPSASDDMVVIEKYGEVVASSQFEIRFPSSSGGTSRVNITTSGRDNIREQSLALLKTYGDFTSAQNYSEFHSTFAEKTGHMASWTSPYPALSQRLSDWTFVVVIERAIYFGSLDLESDKTVAILAFAFTALGYLFSVLFTSHQKVSQDKSAWSKSTRSLMLSDMIEQEELDAYSSTGKLQRTQGNEIAECFPPAVDWRDTESEQSLESDYMSDSMAAAGVGATGAGVGSDVHKSALADHVHEFSAQHAQFGKAPKLKIDVGALPGAEADSSLQDWSMIHQNGWACQCSKDVDLKDVDRCHTCAWKSADLLELAQNQKLTNKLLTATRLRLEPLVARFEENELGRNQRRNKMHQKSVEFLYDSIQRNQNVFDIICLEAKFGEDSRAIWIYKQYDGWLYNWLHHLLLTLFIFAEFIPFSDTRIAIDSVLMFVFTCDTSMAVWARVQVHGVTLDRFTAHSVLINALMWVLIVLEIVVRKDAFLGICRPMMFIVKTQIVRDTIRVLSKCIEQSWVILALLFTAVTIAAIMAMLLFNNKFDPNSGHTVDTFFDSFVYIFVYLTSGENYDALVYQGLTLGKATFSSSSQWLWLESCS